ncbi:MAG: hypothetical protein ABJA66_13840 [Actinomycetota bacterium]
MPQVIFPRRSQRRGKINYRAFLLRDKLGVSDCRFERRKSRLG